MVLEEDGGAGDRERLAWRRHWGVPIVSGLGAHDDVEGR